MPKFIKITDNQINSKSGYFVPCQEISKVVKNMYDDMEHIDTGESIIFTIVEMSQEEYDKLPKFDKW